MIFGPAERIAAVGPPQSRHQGHRPRAAGRHEIPRRGPDPRLRPDRVRAGPGGHARAQLRVAAAAACFVEITGTEATLALPDPNRFDGEIRLRATGADDWQVLPVTGAADGRGLGVLDMARALRGGGRPRASGEMGLHVVETMEAIARSAADHSFQPVRSAFSLPEALDPAWDPKARTLVSA